MRRIEEANKFELTNNIVARALADEMIEGWMSPFGTKRTSRRSQSMSACDLYRKLRWTLF
jgi:hypothetical protein